MKVVTGNPVKGENFFDREQEQRRIWRKLESDHILLLAPRRIGKTSLLYRLCETAGQHESEAIYCSFAPCDSELACMSELMKAVGDHQGWGKKLLAALGTRLKRIKGIKVAGSGIDLDTVEEDRWQAIGESFTATLADFDGRWLITIDELPLFVLGLLGRDGGKERARVFLNWFRNQRQLHADNVRWILAGSIGLDTVAARHGFGDTINDLDLFPLGAFSEPTARRFVHELAGGEGMPLSDEVCCYLIERVGWPVPYYIQLLFSQLLEQWEADDREPDTRSVDNAFEALLAPAHRNRFDYWRQRLREELGEPEAGLAIHLLNAICQDRQGASRSTLAQRLNDKITGHRQLTESKDAAGLLRYLLDVLETDGYIVEVGARYRFRLEWLREYWRRRVAV